MLRTPSQLKKADDLFEKSSMTFGEHLEALRKCLIWAFGFLGIGMCIGLPMGNWVLNYLQGPLKVAIFRYEEARSRKEIELKTGRQVSDDFFAWMRENHRYWQEVEVDIEALRRIVQETGGASGSTTSKTDEIKKTDKPTKSESDNAEPLIAASKETSSNKIDDLSVDRLRKIELFFPIDAKTEALGLQEPFMIWFKAGCALGFVIASPGIFYSLWTFVAAGLYPHERRYVYFFLPISIGLFLSGAALAFFFIFQFVIDFLLQFNDAMGIDASPRLTDYMSFAIFLPLGFGLAFQLPLAMLALERLGICSIGFYTSQWRGAVLLIAFLSMILTPAEPTSMIGMCVPLVLLYFLGIGLCYWLPRKGSPHEGYDPK
jgi:sec-independent protein translocase protein TatC